MDKEIVSLMCEKIKEQSVDVNQMVRDNPEKAIVFLHGAYQLAKEQHQKKSQSLPHR